MLILGYKYTFKPAIKVKDEIIWEAMDEVISQIDDQQFFDHYNTVKSLSLLIETKMKLLIKA